MGLSDAREEGFEVEDPSDLAHERYSALVRAIAAVIWTATPDGSTRISPDWTRLTGQTPEGMVGYGWLDALHADDRARTRDAWRTAVIHQTPYDTDYRILCDDGIYRWFNARGAPVLNRTGAIREWVGVCLPITGSQHFQQAPEPRAMPGGRLTAAQVRAARAMLGWSVAMLSEMSGLSPSTIARMESETRCAEIRTTNLDAARLAFEAEGISFTWTVEGIAGVRHPGATDPGTPAPPLAERSA